MKTTIESVKDEVASRFNDDKGKPFENLHYLVSYYAGIIPTAMSKDIIRAVDEVAELYHTRKCEEAGSELSSDEQLRNNSSHADSPASYSDGAHFVKQEASKLLASLQSKLIEGQKNSNRFLTAWEKQLEDIKQLQSQLEAKDKEIEEWKIAHKGTSAMLQEAKAEAEKVRQEGDLFIKQFNRELDLAKAEVEGFAVWLMDNCSMRNSSKKWHIVKGAFTESFTTEQVYEKYKSQLTLSKGEEKKDGKVALRRNCPYCLGLNNVHTKDCPDYEEPTNH